MDATDKAAFDAEHATLTSLRSTTQGAQMVEHVESVAKVTANALWTFGGPIVKAGGEAAIQALANFAASSLEAELTRLAGGK